MIDRFLGAASLALVFLPAGIAHAADIPSFLSAGQIYAESQDYCIGPDEEPDGERPITIDKGGVSGHESGCDFIEYKPVINRFAEPGAEPDTYVITASCGDDSGITRPDFYNISFYDNSLWVTSQNDYMYDLLRQRADDDFESWGFVNKQYVLCLPK